MVTDMNGLTHLYYGDGKGKTTAAVGLALRAAGQGMQVIFAQFFKTMPTGEIAMLKELGVTVLRADLPAGFTWNMTEEELAEIREKHDALLQNAFAAISGEKTLLILDECVDAYAYGYLNKELMLSCCRERCGSVELALTGHCAPEEIVSFCDYVTEMKAVRHPYEKGITARRGIEF